MTQGYDGADWNPENPPQCASSMCQMAASAPLAMFTARRAAPSRGTTPSMPMYGWGSDASLTLNAHLSPCCSKVHCGGEDLELRRNCEAAI
jgi:hypothetical protein